MTEIIYQNFTRETEAESIRYMGQEEGPIRQFMTSVNKRSEEFLNGCDDSEKDKYRPMIKKHIIGLGIKLLVAEQNLFVIK